MVLAAEDRAAGSSTISSQHLQTSCYSSMQRKTEKTWQYFPYIKLQAKANLRIRELLLGHTSTKPNISRVFTPSKIASS